jgi:hypothetical protein
VLAVVTFLKGRGVGLSRWKASGARHDGRAGMSRRTSTTATAVVLGAASVSER